jgi:DNA polymerase-3 subunit alpha
MGEAAVIDERTQKELEAADEADRKFSGPKDFVHLHTHSLFSTLDGVASPEQYVQRAAQVGMKALGLTDHGSLAGLPNAYWEAKKQGIKLLAGCEIYLNDYHLQFKEMQEKGIKLSALKESDPELVERFRRNRHLTVICQNMTGYRNLISLMREGYEMGLYYNKPRTWFDQLKKYKEGLIIISGCLNGPVCHELRKGSECRDKGDHEKQRYYYGKALDYVKQYRAEFGDNFYLELQMPGATIERGKEVFYQIAAISKKTGIPAVMTGDIHYLHRSDFELQKTMMAVEQQTTVDDPNLFHVDSNECFFKTRAQFRQTFIEQEYDKYDGVELLEQACDNTVAIAEKCEAFSPDLSPKLPEVQDADIKIRRLVSKALIQRGLHKDESKYFIDGRMVTYREQVKIELQRIIEKRFSSYFLITMNLVQHARTNSWDVGPARGSAGGSLVCFLLGIHDLDPLKWGLSFDRFLSPSRGGFMLEIKGFE